MNSFTPPNTPSELPTLDLPPAPFGRFAPSAPPLQRMEAPAELPSGTSLSELLDALALDGARPHAEFTTAVERRNRNERRSEPRPGSLDRRDFTSANLAAPSAGPTDPRPTMPPPSAHAVVSRPMPIDAVMPPLPLSVDHELQPARPYELPNRGIVTGTQRTTRPNVAATEIPFPSHAAPVAAQPETQPETLPAAESFPALDVAPDQPAPNANQPVNGIDGIFAGAAPIPVGRLEPWAAAPMRQLPDHGPAGPAIAPGAGLDPTVAAVAAAPSAWFGGGAVEVDDAMLVWNAPHVTAPLAPSVAAAIAPAGASATAPIATTALAPTVPTGGAIGAAAGASRSGSSLLRTLLIVGIPSSAGIAIAFAIDRFAF